MVETSLSSNALLLLLLLLLVGLSFFLFLFSASVSCEALMRLQSRHFVAHLSAFHITIWQTSMVLDVQQAYDERVNTGPGQFVACEARGLPLVAETARVRTPAQRSTLSGCFSFELTLVATGLVGCGHRTAQCSVRAVRQNITSDESEE